VIYLGAFVLANILIRVLPLHKLGGGWALFGAVLLIHIPFWWGSTLLIEAIWGVELGPILKKLSWLWVTSIMLNTTLIRIGLDKGWYSDGKGREGDG
jgi:hypothetical protein